MEYKLIRERASRIGDVINLHLKEGWKLKGDTFKTGNRILTSGDPVYPITCSYASEIAQAMVKEATT